MIVTNGPSVTVPGTGKVVIENFIIITSNGRIVGTANGEFDFSGIAPEHHVAVVNALLRDRLRLATAPAPSYTDVVPVPPTPPASSAAPIALGLPRKPWWRFW